MALKPWYQVVFPREDLREGRPLDAAEFAVHLDQVQAGRAPDVYQNPKQFFERTYLTQNLTTLASQVMRRLSGIQTETSAVFNMATQFGGGKTHSLTLLYHLAQHGHAANPWQGVAKLLEQAGLKSVPQAKTAVFVGQKFDPRGGDDGTPLRRTPWGEIAWQLAGEAGFKLVASFDEGGNSPGGDTIGKLFRLVNQPILILMDELMNYISRYRRMGLGGQLYNFIQNLSEEARGHDNVALAVSIPASELEMSADDQADYERTKKLLDRVGKAIMMAAEAETSEIIRRRLFEWEPQAVGQVGKVILNRDALAACNAYADWVVGHRQQVPGWFPVDNARDMFAATYPFHPALISVFERKWQSLPRFQQTRGILRLLALWVSHTYQAGYRGAYRDPIIGLGTAPLEEPLFRAAVFEQLGEAKLEVPVTTDICGKKESHALRLDVEAVEAIKKARLHRKVATTIFFESNGGHYRQGCTVPEIRLNVAEPELDAGNVETVLEELNRTLYYLHAEHNRYRFSLTPALNKLLADRLATIKPASINECVLAEIGKAFPPGVVERILFANHSSQIPDRPQLTLIVLSPDYPLQEPETINLVEKMTKEHGSSARTYKSALIWAIADTAASLKDDARKLLAWEDIKDEVDAGGHKLDGVQENQLDASVAKARKDLRETVWRSYKNLALLDRSNEIRVIDLGLVHSSAATTLMNLMVSRLRQDGEIEDSISPNFLVRNWPPAFTEWSTRSVRDAFFASPQFPKLLNAEAIKDTVANGVMNGILGYAGKVGDEYNPFYFETDLSAYAVEISDDMFVIPAGVAREYLKRIVSIEVSPGQITLEPGQQQIFAAKGRNQQGQEVALTNLEWQVTQGGAIDQNGLFRAGQIGGAYAVTASLGRLSGSATIVVKGLDPGLTLKSIVISPQQAYLEAGQTQTFAATGIYSNGSEIPLTNVVWQAAGGQIDAAGRFLAGSTPGKFVVRATSNDITGSSSVTINKAASSQRFSWRGQIPPQKWTNFYMKVLTKFASSQDLEMKLQVEVSVEARDGGQLSEQKLEEIKIALRELGLDDRIERE